MILDRIIETKKEEVKRLKQSAVAALWQKEVADMAPPADFRAAISYSTCSIIAEVKCASPSRGRLVKDFDPLFIAQAYEKNKAAAISVLTDENYFCGHINHLRLIKNSVRIPVLRKDFIIDPLQIYETRAGGADAILLIVRVLGKNLSEFIGLSGELGLQQLVEVHSPDELEVALSAGAEIIGLNNRNLDTFVTDINTSKTLKAKMPKDKIAVAESAISSRGDIEFLMNAGIKAFLIGEALVTALDVGKKLRMFLGEEQK